MLIFNDNLNWFQSLMEKKEQTLVYKCPFSELEGITDRQILEKIINNLLSNALKYTHKGGTITITISEPDADTWQLSIKDN